MTIPLETVLATLPPERQNKIKARAAELIAEERALRDLRRTRRLTQAQVAERLGGRQVYVSRLEKRSDMKLSTLRDYVGALGGELSVLVTFPEGETATLGRLGESGPSKTRAVARAPGPKAA